MKKNTKVIRLNEEDLARIIEKVIEEQKPPLLKLPIRNGGDSQAFVKVENGKKYIYLESEMFPGKTTKIGPVIADHLKDKEKFMIINQNGKLIGNGKEIVLIRK
jgi:hypothetical protein